MSIEGTQRANCILTQDFARISKKQGCVDTACHKAYCQIGHAVHAGCALPCRRRPGFILQRRKRGRSWHVLTSKLANRELNWRCISAYQCHSARAFMGCSIFASFWTCLESWPGPETWKAKRPSIAEASKLLRYFKQHYVNRPAVRRRKSIKSHHVILVLSATVLLVAFSTII